MKEPKLKTVYVCSNCGETTCRTGAVALPPESPALGASVTTSSFMVFQLPPLDGPLPQLRQLEHHE